MSASSVSVSQTRDTGAYVRGWISYVDREIHEVSGFLQRFVPDNDIRLRASSFRKNQQERQVKRGSGSN